MKAKRLLRTLSVAAAFVLAAGSAVPAGAQVNAEQVLNIGRNVLSMEDYMLAIQYFNQAIKAKPYLSDPYFFRGLAKLNLDDYKGAEADCSMAIERNRFKTEAYKVRGFARQQIGLDSLAVMDYDRGLEHNPIDKYFLFYKAVAQTRLKRYQAADTTFGALLRQYPHFDEGFAARGRLNVLRGDTAAALRDIESALRISKMNISPYLMRADINARRLHWAEALADMDEAVRMAPEETDLYINRAYLRYNNDDYYGAMSDYNYALELEPDNATARFNRGLLRFEVRDLKSAAADFSAVLQSDPSNFHALYNRGLIRLQLADYARAQKDFQAIANRYPRFYPVYYAIAECRKGLGDLRGAFANMDKADRMVRRYVDNPERNPLDRPTISRATSNDADADVPAKEMTDNEVMDRFNQLVTSSDVNRTRLSYNERIKGRVQDRDLRIEPEPLYALSFRQPEASLRSVSDSFRDLDNLNQRHYLPDAVYLVPGTSALTSEADIKDAFDRVERLSAVINAGSARPVDYMARAILYTMLRNYSDAVSDFTKALEANPEFTVALMGRAYAAYMQGTVPAEGETQPAPDPAASVRASHAMTAAMADYDAALKTSPSLAYAWFNKGYLYYLAGDYTSAMQAFAEAIRIDPAFGQAFFNRGLCYLRLGNRQQAFADLSKAGELGVLPSYNVLKRMK